MSYPRKSPLCLGRLRAIPPLAGLSVEESTLTAGEKSAEGVVVPLMRDEGATVSREGIK